MNSRSFREREGEFNSNCFIYWKNIVYYFSFNFILEKNVLWMWLFPKASSELFFVLRDYLWSVLWYVVVYHETFHFNSVFWQDLGVTQLLWSIFLLIEMRLSVLTSNKNIEQHILKSFRNA
jgi:hypothetical protein